MAFTNRKSGGGKGIAKFWSRVDVRQPDECWEWKGPGWRPPYGHFSIDGKLEPAHRIAWEFVNGPIPESEKQKGRRFILHRCDNHRCCNPGHLRLGTHAENMQDIQQRRHECGMSKPVDRKPLHPGRRTGRPFIKRPRKMNGLPHEAPAVKPPDIEYYRQNRSKSHS